MTKCILRVAAATVCLSAGLPGWADDGTRSETGWNQESMKERTYGRWDEEDGDSRPAGWLPYTSYGYAGMGVGAADYERGGCQPGTACDGSDTGFKVFAGGQLNRVLGLELSYIDMGKVARNDGDTWARGLNLGLLVNAPVGLLNLYGKLGIVFGWTHISSSRPGVVVGKEADFNISYGLGVQVDVSRNWAIRADWDSYRLQFADGRDSVDLYTIGIVYKY